MQLSDESNPEELNSIMESIIQRIATGPDLSKDIEMDEARLGMKALLDEAIDPVRSAIFLIALRMKRETPEENRGILQAILDHTERVRANVDEIIDIADPYDGYNRTIPASPFLAPILAEFGLNAVSHGLDVVGPKYGITHRHVLQAAGMNVDLSPSEAVKKIEDENIGWAYIDQAQFAPKLHDLIDLRGRMIKRSVITTVEVLAKPVVGRKKTHFITGYVHKPYPPVYADLARLAGFDTAVLVRGVEGGIIPSLRQAGRYFAYHDLGQEEVNEISPADFSIDQKIRCVPIPEDVPQTAKGEGAIKITNIEAGAKRAAEFGLAALGGEKGATYDSLVYSGAIILKHLNKVDSFNQGSDAIRSILDSGKAVKRIC